MLEDVSIRPNVALDQKDLSSTGMEISTKDVSLVWPDVLVSEGLKGELVKPEIKVSSRVVAFQLHNEEMLREINELKKFASRFDSSPTYHSKMSSVLKLAGNIKQSLEHAKVASELSTDSRYSFLLGKKYLDSNDMIKAIKVFEQPINSDNAEAILKLAEISLINNQIKDAEEFIQRLLELNPLDWRGISLAGTISLIQGKLEEAIQLYKLAIRDNNKSTTTYLNMAVAYFFLGQEKNALKSLCKATAISPTNKNALLFFSDLEYHSNLGSEQLEAALIRFLKINDSDPEVSSRLISLIEKKGDYKRGINLFRPIADKLNDSGVYNNLGVLYSHLDIGKAENYYIKAIEANTDDGQDYGWKIAVLNLATVYLQKQQPNNSIMLLEKCMQLIPMRDYTYNAVLSRIPSVYVNALSMAEQTDKAASIAGEYLNDSKLHLEGQMELAAQLSVCYSMSIDQPEIALGYARQALNIAQTLQLGNRINVHLNNLIFVLIETGHLKEAKELLPNLKLDIAGQAYPLATKGLYHFRIGEFDKGESYYKKAISISQNYTAKEQLRLKLNYESAIAALELNKPNKAKRMLKKVVNTHIKYCHWQPLLWVSNAQKMLSSNFN